MSEIAFVVLAHNDPPQVRRLLAALAGQPVLLHCDARTPTGTYDDMVANLPEHITLLDRRRTHLASWSLVDAELQGLERALAQTDAQHFAVLSGADYPLASMSQIVTELQPWLGHSCIASLPLPWPRWSTPLHGDGGLWRLRHRFVTRHDELLFAGRIPLRTPWRRRIPGDVELRASSQWKVLSRRHVELLLTVTEARPDLVAFWRTTLVPEETYVASVLSSPALVGEDALRMSEFDPWFIEWPVGRTDHPHWLGPGHYELLEAARAAPLMHPTDIAPGPNSRRKLFARKFGTATAGDLLDRVDAELRA